MKLPITEKLFEHKCRFNNMKVSGYNPETINFYCDVCGGKLALKRTDKAESYIKAKGTMKLSKKLLALAPPDGIEGKE